MLFLSGLFLSNYADSNNLYSIEKELNIIKEKLQKYELESNKFHSMYLSGNKENDTFNFKNWSLRNSKEEVTLSLTIDD